MMNRIVLAMACVFGCAQTTCLAQTDNALLDRSFWKSQPTLPQVRELVDLGNDPTALNEYDFDAMSWALIGEADSDVLQFLLEFDGNGVNKLTHDERTYMFWAAYKSNLPIMRELAARGAKFDLVDEHGYSLLNFAAVTGQMDTDVYDFIINHGGSPDRERNADGAHALLLVAPFITNDDMPTYFEPFGLSMEDVDKDASNGWLYACKGGQVKMLRALLDQGMDAKYVNALGENAAHFAVRGTRGRRNGREVFEFFDSLGVDIHAPNKSGVTPMLMAVQGKFDSDGLEFLIETAPSLYHQDSKGNTVMHHALMNGSIEACKMLKENGWTMREANYRGSTLVQALAKGYRPSGHDTFEELCAFLKHEKIPLVQVLDGGEQWLHVGARTQSLPLLKFGLLLGLDVNQRDSDGLTPLHEACLTATNSEIIDWLVAVGADVQATTEFGETAGDLARENEAFEDEMPSSLIIE